MKRLQRLRRPAAVILTTAVAQAATAQTVPGSSVTLDTIKVVGDRDAERRQLDKTNSTGSRLGLTALETPASVEVLNQQTMQERGARTFTEALRGAAGVIVGDPPSAPGTISMRGFTSTLTLYDGLRVSGAGVVNRIQDTWNYERIEVLKGPASVLNGDTAVGGIVNYITKQPDRDNPGGEAMLALGSYGSKRAGVGYEGALGSMGAFRFDFSRNDSKHGLVPNVGEKVDHLTAGARFDLTPSTRMDVSLDYLHDDNRGYFGTPLVPASFATESTDVVSTPDGRVIDERIAKRNYNTPDNENASETYWLRGRLTHRLAGGWTARNELAFNKADRIFKNSESAVFQAPGDIVRDQTLITHDTQYLVNRLDALHEGDIGGLANKFNIGIEGARSHFDSERRFSDGSVTTRASLLVPALGPSPGNYDLSPALTTGAGNRSDQTTRVTNYAVFAEDALRATQALTVVAGLRRERTEIDRTIADLNAGTSSAYGTNFNSTSGRLGLVYAATPQTSLYAQFSSATLPVGSLFLLSSANTAFKPSKGRQLETGFKQVIPDTRFEWTAAVYYIELDNVLSRSADNPNVTVNNGKQSSRGLELTAAWRPWNQLSLSGNLSMLNARYDTLREADGVSRVGNTPTNVPERLANLFAAYRFESVPVDLTLGLNHTGKIYTDTANTIRINGHTTADVGATYRWQNVALTTRVRNVTDKLYATYAGRATSQVLLAPRRTFEVSAQVSF